MAPIHSSWPRIRSRLLGAALVLGTMVAGFVAPLRLVAREIGDAEKENNSPLAPRILAPLEEKLRDYLPKHLIPAARSNAQSRIKILSREDRLLDQSVGYTVFKGQSGGGPVKLHILTYNITSGRYRVLPALAGNRVYYLKKLTDIVAQHGALAGVNGTYFLRRSPYLPIGFIMVNGQVTFITELKRSAIGITDYGQVVVGMPEAKGLVITANSGDYFYIYGMNRPRKNNEVIVYTSYYGERTKTNPHGVEIIVQGNKIKSLRGGGNSIIPYDGYVISLHGKKAELIKGLAVGQSIRFVFSIRKEWETVSQVVTGGPILLQNGSVRITASEEGFSFGQHTRNPLTAIAYTNNQKLMMIVVDGRQAGYSVGASYHELAYFLRELGTTQALCMDGGGSSTMVVQGRVVNRPSDGAQRPISNALVLQSWNR